MSDTTLGEIRIVGFNFAPQGWATCNGQLLAISEYDALYTLLGTTYGGDGINTFAVPNMNGRAVVGAQGQGPGLSNYPPGALTGSTGVSLTSTQIPNHGHNVAVPFQAVGSGTATASATGNFPAVSPSAKPYAAAATAGATLNAQALTVAVGVAGASAPHNNMQPSLALNYIIATQGVYPSRP